MTRVRRWRYPLFDSRFPTGHSTKDDARCAAGSEIILNGDIRVAGVDTAAVQIVPSATTLHIGKESVINARLAKFGIDTDVVIGLDRNNQITLRDFDIEDLTYADFSNF